MVKLVPEVDAIVVGSGISGGWAAKELTEKGLKVLLLERGRYIEHAKDYVGEHRPPWQQGTMGLEPRALYQEEYPVQSTSYAFDETTRHFWNNDAANPYDFNPEAPFHWMRADVLGGRSLLWARQSYRWSDLDFEANKREGIAIDWPIRYADIAPWYDYVERYIGVSGQPMGLSQLPDGQFQKPMPMNVVERHVAQSIASNFEDRVMMIGRTATLTEPLPGRAPCHYCGPCHRGCSTGSYFSSLSSTLPAAKATGRLTIRTDAVVSRLNYDTASQKVLSVDAVDTRTKEGFRVSARLIFLCASTVGTTQILLNSPDPRGQSSFANRSGALGRYMMDHTYAAGARGIMPGFEQYYPYGFRPNGIYIPRFRNLRDGENLNFTRGYGYQGGAGRLTWRGAMNGDKKSFGAEFKERLSRPGPWYVSLGGFGEILPYAHNEMRLHPKRVDRFGIPLVSFNFTFGQNEMNHRKDLIEQAVRMLESAGVTQIQTYNAPMVGGAAIHEMGTARMGDDPRDAVLNKFNQAHAADNLFVTDGACMTSASCVNPSLTYMALTARAANYAVEQVQSGAI
ncbi:MAG: GMC family oxidoreductase [Pseudomonadota bacterium]